MSCLYRDRKISIVSLFQHHLDSLCLGISAESSFGKECFSRCLLQQIVLPHVHETKNKTACLLGGKKSARDVKQMF